MNRASSPADRSLMAALPRVFLPLSAPRVPQPTLSARKGTGTVSPPPAGGAVPFARCRRFRAQLKRRARGSNRIDVPGKNRVRGNAAASLASAASLVRATREFGGSARDEMNDFGSSQLADLGAAEDRAAWVLSFRKYSWLSVECWEWCEELIVSLD